MTQAARIDWKKTPHELGQAVIKYGRDLTPAAVAFLRDEAPRIAERMQHEAPWTDRTGQARRELRTEVEVQGERATLYLITGAPHGMYLELRWGGRYAIVSPMIPRAGISIGAKLRRGIARGTPGRR